MAINFKKTRNKKEVFGSKITEIERCRRLAGWNQRDLAKKIKISQQMISRYERHLTVPTLTYALKMLRVFKSAGIIVDITKMACDYN